MQRCMIQLGILIAELHQLLQCNLFMFILSSVWLAVFGFSACHTLHCWIDETQTIPVSLSECDIPLLVNLLFAQSRHYKQLVPSVIVVSWFITILANCGVIRPGPFKLIFMVFPFFASINSDSVIIQLGY